MYLSFLDFFCCCCFMLLQQLRLFLCLYSHPHQPHLSVIPSSHVWLNTSDKDDKGQTVNPVVHSAH